MLPIVPILPLKSGGKMGVKMPNITVKEYANRTPRKSKLVEKGVSFRVREVSKTLHRQWRYRFTLLNGKRDEITLPASGDKREHLAADLWSFGDEDSVCSVYATAILPYKGIAYGYCFNRSLKTMVVTETEMNVGQGRPSSEYSVMKCS